MSLFPEIDNIKRQRSKTEIPQDTISYRPSCGTDGLLFEEAFCTKCGRFKYNKEIEAYKCELDIIFKSQMYQIEDKQYPKWLRSDKDGTNIRCLKFEKIQ